MCGNVEDTYSREEIDGQLKTELMTALQPAFAKISALGVRYSAIPAHTQEIADALNEILTQKWKELRGIEIVAFGVSSVKASDEDEQMIKDLQRNAAFKNPTMAAAELVGAQAEAMKLAAANEGNMGAAMGFMGMNMANQAGGMNPANLYAMGAQQAQQPVEPAPQATPNQATPAADANWTCGSCNTVNTGKFCGECGAARPSADWTCSCGTVNTGKFCSECGNKRP